MQEQDPKSSCEIDPCKTYNKFEDKQNDVHYDRNIYDEQNSKWWLFEVNLQGIEVNYASELNRNPAFEVVCRKIPVTKQVH